MVQHALLLDENSMPIIQDGELQRDNTSAKTRQPVMRIVEVEKEVKKKPVYAVPGGMLLDACVIVWAWVCVVVRAAPSA